jgi:hypothetical protein
MAAEGEKAESFGERQAAFEYNLSQLVLRIAFKAFEHFSSTSLPLFHHHLFSLSSPLHHPHSFQIKT